jgi:ABC-type amino acid transport substrate-binding protein
MSSKHALRLLCFLPLALLWYSLPGHGLEPADKPPMVVRYHKTESLADLNAFHFALVNAALEITRPEFGDYVIEPYGLAPTAKRQAILLSEGTLLNLQWASPGTPISQADVVQIPFDFLQSILGYRICLINSKARVNLADSAHPGGLKKVRIGQGYDWTDVEVYRHNQIPIFVYPGLENLIPALGLNRIDCLALGANEVQFKYEDLKKKYPFLKVDPSLILYYHFPIHFYVSKKHPELAQRMTIGLDKLQKSGAYNELFNQHYAQYLAPLNLQNRKIICLVNPYLSTPNQCSTPIEVPQIKGLGVDNNDQADNSIQN